MEYLFVDFEFKNPLDISCHDFSSFAATTLSGEEFYVKTEFYPEPILKSWNDLAFDEPECIQITTANELVNTFSDWLDRLLADEITIVIDNVQDYITLNTLCGGQFSHNKVVSILPIYKVKYGTDSEVDTATASSLMTNYNIYFCNYLKLANIRQRTALTDARAYKFAFEEIISEDEIILKNF